MGLLRFIWKDIRSLNRLSPAVKIAGLIVGIIVVLGACYLGAEWWTTPVTFRGKTLRNRPATPPLELAGVILGILFIMYIAWVIERYRNSR